jgi:hypothetical protein
MHSSLGARGLRLRMGNARGSTAPRVAMPGPGAGLAPSSRRIPLTQRHATDASAGAAEVPPETPPTLLQRIKRFFLGKGLANQSRAGQPQHTQEHGRTSIRAGMHVSCARLSGPAAVLGAAARTQAAVKTSRCTCLEARALGGGAAVRQEPHTPAPPLPRRHCQSIMLSATPCSSPCILARAQTPNHTVLRAQYTHLYTVRRRPG